MAYEKGDNCMTCGREVVLEKCCFCGGTGKAKDSEWAFDEHLCAGCMGRGEGYKCPVILPIDDFIKGRRCSEVTLPGEKP